MQNIEKLKIEEDNKKEHMDKECCKECKNGQRGKCHEKIIKKMEEIELENINQQEN